MKQIHSAFSEGVANCVCPFCSAEAYTVLGKTTDSRCCHLDTVTQSDSEAIFYFDYDPINIFYYEKLQSLLNIVPPRTQKIFINKLNSRIPKDVHPVEWELVMLDWIQKLGEVDYESVQPNGKRPDISFRNSIRNINIISDIACVSDDTIKKIYPADDFIKHIIRVLRKATNGKYRFHIRFNSSTKSNFSMFPPSRIKENVNRLELWAQNNQEKLILGSTHSYWAENNLISFVIVDKDKSDSFTHPSRTYTYNERYSNPVCNILTKKATSQLTEHNDSLIGIFLCDGDCQLLSPRVSTWNSVSIKDIILDVFCDHRHIDFIVVLSITRIGDTSRRPYISYDLYTNNNLPQNKASMLTRLDKLLTESLDSLSNPYLFPYRSTQRLLDQKTPGCYWIYKKPTASSSRDNNI